VPLDVPIGNCHYATDAASRIFKRRDDCAQLAENSPTAEGVFQLMPESLDD
jgi:hypothetical protein